MIIGHGDIAWALREGGLDRPDLTFFAAGVSNSGETRQSEYDREFETLVPFQHCNHLIYFSSLCVFYSDNRYTWHKHTVEDYIRDWWASYTIIRIGNITWGANPHTLINYLRAHPEAPLRDEYRYICDLYEFAHWVRLIPDWSCEMNIPGRRMLVKDIYQEFVVNARERA